LKVKFSSGIVLPMREPVDVLVNVHSDPIVAA